MVKSRSVLIKLSEEQYTVLINKASSAGFTKNAEYIRFKILWEDKNGA